MGLEDLIEERASQASSISGDAGSVSQRSISELIKADQYLASKAASANSNFGLRRAKWRPPGTVEGVCE